MTVHRVGPKEEAPHRTDLGRVIVTIDDLAALMAFLARSMAGVTAKIPVEFDGGSFTEPDELGALSDMEIQSLRLKTQRVEVVLNPSAAFAIGDRQEAEDVYRIWARARQTRLRPPRLPIWWVEVIMMGIMVAGFLLAFVAAYRLSQSNDAVSGFLVFTAGIVTGLTFAVTARLSWRRRERIAPSSYAVVIPQSLKEYRERRSSQTYPRRSWIVAIVAAIIAAAAVGVAVWAVLSR